MEMLLLGRMGFIGVIYCECTGTISVDDCLHIDFTKILELA